MVESRDYAVGFDEAMEYAQRVYRKLVSKIGSGTLADIFDGEDSVIRIIEKYSLKDIAERLEKHIEVGDEVILFGRKMVVLMIGEDGVPEAALEPNGNVCTITRNVKSPKTGRHFDEVGTLLNKMRGNLE